MVLKGRHWAAVWLLAFLGAAWIVIARQTASLRAAAELAQLREQRATLEGRAAALDREIRAAESRAVLERRARETLGLRLPADTEIILLPVPAH